MKEDILVKSREQTLLSHQRTSLSMIRTGLAFIGVGLIVVNFWTEPIWKAVGVALMVIGFFEVFKEYYRLRKYQEEEMAIEKKYKSKYE